MKYATIKLITSVVIFGEFSRLSGTSISTKNPPDRIIRAGNNKQISK